MQMDEQLIIANAFHYNENNKHRPCRISSVGYENNQFKVKKEYVEPIERNSVLLKLSSKCFESVVTL